MEITTVEEPKVEVYCTLQVEGTHEWPECPFDEVGYLRNTHRHVFHVKAYVPVTHDDRDVEFIMLKHHIDEYLFNAYGEGDICKFGSMSCEMIARELLDVFNLSCCEVSEDGENGAIVTAGKRIQ